ncbi:MAG: sulfite exporter TauE/SafE family protein [Spirochaetota bacterium]
MPVSIFLTGFVVFITHAIEAVTGFGCTVLAFPFVTALVGIKEAKVILSIMAWLLAVYFVITKFKKINFRQFGIIVTFACLGMPIGIFLFNKFPADILKTILGIFIIVTSLIQLQKIFFPEMRSITLHYSGYLLILFFGGIVHGAFATGGPFIVLYATRNLRDKGEFRATLCLLWATLNSILFVTDPTFSSFFGSMKNTIIYAQPLSTDVIHVAWMFPFLIAGIFAGECIHERVNPDLFKKIVFFVLLFTGIFMTVTPLILR